MNLLPSSLTSLDPVDTRSRTAHHSAQDFAEKIANIGHFPATYLYRTESSSDEVAEDPLRSTFRNAHLAVFGLHRSATTIATWDAPTEP
jgi:hypothetical protein